MSKPLPGLPPAPSGLRSSTDREPSGPAEAIIESKPLRLARTIGSDGSLAANLDSVPCLGECSPGSAEDFEASLDASLTLTPKRTGGAALVDEQKRENARKRMSVPPSLPSFSDFKLVAALNWQDGGTGLDAIGSRSSLMAATLDVK